MTDEHAALFNGKHHSIEEYRQAIEKIAGIYSKIADIEKRYLFLMAMREHARMEGALSSDEFEKLFIE